MKNVNSRVDPKNSTKNKKPFNLKWFIGKHYKGILLFIFFVLGVAFPAVVFFQYFLTGLLICMISQLIGKIVTALDRFVLAKLSPVPKNDLKDLATVLESMGLSSAPAEVSSEAQAIIDSLMSEDEFFEKSNQ